MWDDDPYEGMYDEILRNPPEDLVMRVLDDFTADQLRSYFLEHPLLTESAQSLLVEACKLLHQSSVATIALSGASIEVALRDAVVKPVLHGLLHTEHPAIEYLAKPLVDLMFKDDRVASRLLELVAQFGGIDLRNFKRDGSSTELWKEIKEVRQNRNEILHTGSLRDPKSDTQEDRGAPIHTEADTPTVPLSPDDIRKMSDAELEQFLTRLRDKRTLNALKGRWGRKSPAGRGLANQPTWRPLSQEAEHAMVVAVTVMETVVPIVIVNLGFKLSDIRMAQDDSRTEMLVRAHKIRLQS